MTTVVYVPKFPKFLDLLTFTNLPKFGESGGLPRWEYVPKFPNLPKFGGESGTWGTWGTLNLGEVVDDSPSWLRGGTAPRAPQYKSGAYETPAATKRPGCV